jgi:1,4-dihydroxy-2-naphthoate octaprenyltransferase
MTGPFLLALCQNALVTGSALIAIPVRLGRPLAALLFALARAALILTTIAAFLLLLAPFTILVVHVLTITIALIVLSSHDPSSLMNCLVRDRAKTLREWLRS